MAYSTGQTLLTASESLEPPSITVLNTTNAETCHYQYPALNCVTNYTVNFVIPLGHSLQSLSLERVSGSIGFTLDSYSSSSANIYYSRSNDDSGTYTGTYRFATLISGITCYSNNFTLTATLVKDVVVITNSTDYSNSCTYTSPSTSCVALMSVNYSAYTDGGAGVSAHSLQKISGADYQIQSGTLGSLCNVRLVTPSSTTSIGTYRLAVVVVGVTYYSNNFTLTTAASPSAPSVPTINVSGSSSGTCNYIFPATSCNAQVDKTFTISNYTTGVPFANLVSGTSLTVSREGSNSSGTFTFSRNTSDTAPTSSTYRLGLVVGGTTYYSTNFTISLSSTETPYNLGVGLVYTRDCENLSDVPALVSQFNSTDTIVAGKVANCLRTTYPNASANFTVRSVHTNLSAGQPFTYSLWIRATSPAVDTSNDFIYLPNMTLYYSNATYNDGTSTLGTILSSSNYYSYLSSWNNFCVWYDGTTLFVSLNNGKTNTITNVTLKTVAVGSSFKFSASALGVAGRNNGSLPESFIEMDSIFVWNRVLNEAERNVLYNNGSGRAGSTLPSLVGS